MHRSVVWVRVAHEQEIRCDAGTAIHAWRPPHPADLVADASDEVAAAARLAEGAVSLVTNWELGVVQEVSSTGDVFVVQVVPPSPAGGARPEDRKVRACDIFLANPARFDGIADMGRLSELSAPCLLHNLVVRYRANAIYTYTGPLLISINPFQRIPGLYDEATMTVYKGASVRELPPHVFAAAEAAKQSLLRDSMDQSLVISGESGAGKTEAAKAIMRYIVFSSSNAAEQADSVAPPTASTLTTSTPPLPPQRRQSSVPVMRGVEEAILRSNPLTEAFGNAKTARNDNSSRFGKFVVISIDRKGCICGGAMDHYLLEKSRVTHQAHGERNYHIFYQMCAGLNDALRDTLGVGEASRHRFTSQGDCLEVDGVDDGADFGATLDALRSIGISANDEASLLQLLAGILHLGDIEFAASADGSARMDEDTEAATCRALGLEATIARVALCNRKIKAGLEALQVPKSKAEAQASRDAVARSLYTRLFDWLLVRINKCLAATKDSKGTAKGFIGLLDIFGFEIMEENGFEQVCINFANEKLQRYFNVEMLAREQDEYAAEGVAWKPVEFQDNSEVLGLLEAKPNGILPILDDQCLVASSSDASFLAVIARAHGDTPAFHVPKLSHTSFVIRHSAGAVEYQTAAFLDKNKDQLYPDLVEMLTSSSNALVRELYSESKDADKARAVKPGGGGTSVVLLGQATKGGGGRGLPLGKASQHISVSAKFREQLNHLMKTLDRTRPTFVRCIKPNCDKGPSLFNTPLVDHQLRCSGVYSAVKISQAGYPSRVSLRDFAARYRFLLVGSQSPVTAEEERALCERVLASLDVSSALYQLGRSKVFFKGGVLARLEELLSNVLVDSGLLLQACTRRRLTRPLLRMRAAAVTLGAIARRCLARRHHAIAASHARAAHRLQTRVRAALPAQSFARQRAAACTLQTLSRAREARVRVLDYEDETRRAAAAADKKGPCAAAALPLSPAVASAGATSSVTSPASKAQSETADSCLPPTSLARGSEAGAGRVAKGRRGEHGDGGSGGVGGSVRLADGREFTREDVEGLLRDNEKLMTIVSATEGGLSSSLVARSTSLQALMSATPGPEEVAGQAVMTALRQNLTQLEDTFELARIGLRQSSVLKSTVEALRESELALEQATDKLRSLDGIKELVRLQEAELNDKTKAWEVERATLERHILDSNIRRVKVEEEVDNFRHWHEAQLPDLQARAERLKEVEGEYEEVLGELTHVKIRLAEMDEANCVLAQELRKLRVKMGPGGGTPAYSLNTTPEARTQGGHRRQLSGEVDAQAAVGEGLIKEVGLKEGGVKEGGVKEVRNSLWSSSLSLFEKKPPHPPSPHTK